MHVRIDQTKEELYSHLNEQLNFLKKSTMDYDHGDLSEAKRIATHLRILLYDTNKSIALLTSLGAKNGMLFMSTCLEHNQHNLISHTGLVYMAAINDEKGFRASYEPFLNECPSEKSWKPFELWWEEIVIVDRNKNKFTRKDLVLALTNTDGGAHVDPKIEQTYADLSRKNSVGWCTLEKKNEKVKAQDLYAIELATVRQIAFEFLESFNKYNLDQFELSHTKLG